MVGAAFSNRVVTASLGEGANGAEVQVGLLRAQLGAKRSQEASGARRSGRDSGGA